MFFQCEASRTWIKDFVIKQLFSKFPLPNHCAYIGLCEKTMVVRALMNPMTMSETQNALIQVGTLFFSFFGGKGLGVIVVCFSSK
jgi:hypothetical protein